LIVKNLRADVALGVAVFIILATTLLIVFLIFHVSTDEETWKRYTYLLTGVEAVVFAAVGWLFGKEVHREEAEKAEMSRKEAEEKGREASEKAAGEAEKGRGLARAIIAAAEQEPAQQEVLESFGTTGADREQTLLTTPRNMAALAAHARSVPGPLMPAAKRTDWHACGCPQSAGRGIGGYTLWRVLTPQPLFATPAPSYSNALSISTRSYRGSRRQRLETSPLRRPDCERTRALRI
jgi:hypothetical protein